MGLPSINITFTEAAVNAFTMSDRGRVAIIMPHGESTAVYKFESASDVAKQSEWTDDEKGYVQRAFLGYVNQPRSVTVVTISESDEDLSNGLAVLETMASEIDYVCGPSTCTSTEATEIVTWIKDMWTAGLRPRAVVPNTAADFEGVVNFTATGIIADDKEYNTAAYCSRIAGLICGTPLSMSCTSAVLPEVSAVTRLSKSDLDTAIDQGQFVLFHDGEKVKVGRGVTSLVTTAGKPVQFKKIKIVDAVAMIKTDLTMQIQDNYIGQYANTYDNKCVLITAIQGYLDALEAEGVLNPGSVVDIDIDAQLAYLKTQGVDTSEMSEQEIKEAPTGTNVFLRASIKILDAIEDIELNITI